MRLLIGVLGYLIFIGSVAGLTCTVGIYWKNRRARRTE